MLVALRTFALVGLAALIAGCGSSASAPASSSPPLTAPTVTADPATLVLSAGDIGNGFLSIPAQSGKDTLEQAMHQDPAAIRAVERTSWLSGYHALYGDTQANGVLTDATVFRTADAALRVSRSWSQSELQAFHGRSIAAPSGALQHATMVKGSVPVQGVATKAYFVQWVHGNVIAGILTFGRDASPATLAGLATAQDGRIANAG